MLVHPQDLTLPQRIPSTLEDRERIRLRVERAVEQNIETINISRKSLQTLALSLLAELGLSESDVENLTPWTMVLLGSGFWKKRVETVPVSKRVLLLPHCMRHSQNCPAVYDAEGLHCVGCGRCQLADLKKYAESLGYTVRIAEGTPVVMQLILNGTADAILGVGCLKSLERAFEKLQLVGIPAAAVPLLSSTCRDSQADISWIRDLIETPFQAGDGRPEAGGGSDQNLSTQTTNHKSQTTNHNPQSTTWLHLLRGASTLVHSAVDEIIAQKNTNPSTLTDQTQQIALDFLRRGGKFYRPFITLAAFDALTGSLGTTENGPEHIAAFPDVVKKTALAIEVFHKASLVHDDIEDDDPFRYGLPTLHKTHGIPLAINVGDYLVGWGYRLVAASSFERGFEISCDILRRLSEAHLKLCEGQGGELFWKNKGNPYISPSETLKIYALKTSPAFEIALYAGIRWGLFFNAQPVDATLFETVSQYSRNLGIAFQIRNDLDDWTPEIGNKQLPAGDVLKGRPTILWAFAVESLRGQDRETLLELFATLHEKQRENLADPLDEKIVALIFELFEKAKVFRKARTLIEKYAVRTQELTDRIEPEPLRNLLQHLFDSLLF